MDAYHHTIASSTGFTILIVFHLRCEPLFGHPVRPKSPFLQQKCSCFCSNAYGQLCTYTYSSCNGNLWEPERRRFVHQTAWEMALHKHGICEHGEMAHWVFARSTTLWKDAFKKNTQRLCLKSWIIMDGSGLNVRLNSRFETLWTPTWHV